VSGEAGLGNVGHTVRCRLLLPQLQLQDIMSCREVLQVLQPPAPQVRPSPPLTNPHLPTFARDARHPGSAKQGLSASLDYVIVPSLASHVSPPPPGGVFSMCPPVVAPALAAMRLPTRFSTLGTSRWTGRYQPHEAGSRAGGTDHLAGWLGRVNASEGVRGDGVGGTLHL
jgi:hypothetical protein